MTHDLLSGFSQLITPEAIGLLIAGMAIGMFMGMLPGMGVSLALSLMLPFLYHMSVIPAVTLMLATQAASYYAASITAILLNTPGAPESYPTTLDGFPMAKRGEAGRALAISAASTWAGGWIGCVILVALLQVAGSLINLFHPPEFVAIIVLALVLIGGTGESTSSAKVLLSGAVGLMFSFIGSDPVSGVERFTFGSTALLNGLNVVPVALGLFAMTQMVVMFGRNESVTGGSRALLNSGQFRHQVRLGLRDTAANWVSVVRSAVVAGVLGLIPGIGGFSANFISYSLGRQVSRRGREFGTGVPAGIASAEGSSLSKEVGSLAPAVALGLPSGVGMVIFIAALAILGVQPGPNLLKAQPTLPYSMMWVMAIVGLVSCALGLVLTPWLSRATAVRGPVLMPLIVSLAVLGSFAAVTGFVGVVELGVFAVVGVVMRKLGYSLAAMTIGLVLGGTFADNVHLTQQIYGWHFLTRSPLADVFFAIAIVLLAAITWRGRRRGSRAGRGRRIRCWSRSPRPSSPWSPSCTWSSRWAIPPTPGGSRPSCPAWPPSWPWAGWPPGQSSRSPPAASPPAPPRKPRSDRSPYGNQSRCPHRNPNRRWPPACPAPWPRPPWPWTARRPPAPTARKPSRWPPLTAGAASAASSPRWPGSGPPSCSATCSASRSACPLSRPPTA